MLCSMKTMAHSRNARFFVSVRSFIIRSYLQFGVTGSGFADGCFTMNSLTVAIECRNLDWHRLLHYSICYLFRS